MLAVLSPAKKLNFDPLDEGMAQSLPAFQDDANTLAKIARKLSVSDLRSLMKISEDLASLNKARFAAFTPVSDDRNSKQAAFAFAGDTYTGLQISNMEADDVAYAQDHVCILSGLYGVLKPLDRMQPYRLEMGSRLQNKAGSNLYAYWGDRIGGALDQVSGGVVVNCASVEYFKATGKNMTSRVITPAFKEERDGELKMIGFFAKKARGMMARFMVLNRIETPEGLKDFDLEGYKFQPKLSGENDWVFTRKSA
ncbi:MAG: peroxide stress protein YaaA [Proteobacteria bacterium]|nr:peroxide stress protein YaaA [Pseudomonadota bacterium]